MYKFRIFEEKLYLSVSIVATGLSALMLLLIVGTIAVDALPSLSWYFITTAESDTPGLGKGIANAIVGSFVIAVFATLMATPLAVATAIYLQKYARENIFTRIIRFFIEILSGTPSIVLGIFGLIFLVYYLQTYSGGFSLVAGSVALAILILPVIERATEDALARVPSDIEEGSYALGASQWETIKNISIPASLPGIITGAILGFGRAAEESAVVILTAGYTQFFPEIGIKANEKLAFGIKVYPFQDLVGTLPISVYHAYEHSNVIPISDGFAAAFILICIVLSINVAAKIILWRYSHD